MPRLIGGVKRTPKEILDTFGIVLTEAAETYGVAKGAVNYAQWQYVAAGRLSSGSFRFLGSYVMLREHFAPTPNRGTQMEAGLAAIRRILEKTKKQA